MLVVDLNGEVNAPVAITLDAMRVATELAGRPIADLAYVGGGSWRAGGLRLPWSALKRPWDVVVVPGLGQSHSLAPCAALSTVRGQQLVAALRWQHDHGSLLVASCTGTFALAEAGLLNGRFATTSWWLASEFRTRYPKVVLRESALTTEDDRLMCAGGALAHTDLMLALIARLFGPELATCAAHYLVSPWRGPQSAVAEVGQTRLSDPCVVKAVMYIEQHLDQEFGMDMLAQAVATSSRTLHRRVKATLGLSVVGLVRRVRGEQAMKLLRETDLPLSRIAERVGYRDVTTLRALINQLSGQTPAALRRRALAGTQG